ncbi:hypothetical protein AMTR_s00037p00149540, partial [Amborella trichopoda]
VNTEHISVPKWEPPPVDSLTFDGCLYGIRCSKGRECRKELPRKGNLKLFSGPLLAHDANEAETRTLLSGLRILALTWTSIIFEADTANIIASATRDIEH